MEMTPWVSEVWWEDHIGWRAISTAPDKVDRQDYYFREFAGAMWWAGFHCQGFREYGEPATIWEFGRL